MLPSSPRRWPTVAVLAWQALDGMPCVSAVWGWATWEGEQQTLGLWVLAARATGRCYRDCTVDQRALDVDVDVDAKMEYVGENMAPWCMYPLRRLSAASYWSWAAWHAHRADV